MPPNMDGIGTNIEQTKTYDKIVWVPRPSFHFSGMCNVVPYDHAVFKEGGREQAKKEISDHLPLWAEFRVDALTQERDEILNPG